MAVITSEDLKMGPLELFLRASNGSIFKIYIAKKGDEIPSSFGDPEYVDDYFQEWKLTNMRAFYSRINEDFGVTIKEVSEFFYDNVMAPMMKGDLPPIPQSVPQGFANGGLVGMSPGNFIKAANGSVIRKLKKN